jgi:prepilin-type N-terminal cleavage/methylation domain-containing protein
MNRLKKGFTIVELLVVVSIISLLIAILLPAIGKARDSALITQSLGNLRNLSAACVSYAADYNDRQFTAVPDEMGQYGTGGFQGACAGITASQCIPQLVLGWDDNGGLWGYWIRGTPARCANWPGTCGNIIVYVACDFWSNSWLGTWRLTNVKAFNQYISGRYYDKVFWAPKDRLNTEKVEKWFRAPVEFKYDPLDANSFVEPTYCWSPAAMWSPDVMGYQRAVQTSGGGSQDPCALRLGARPDGLAGAYKSPNSSMAQYPSLKWRAWEHQWLQNQDGGEVNPAFSTPTPWYFNHGYNSAPAVMFFDGHTQIVSLAGVMQDDDLSQSQSQPKRPLYFHSIVGQGDGYFANGAYDMMTNAGGCKPVTAGIATVDGILGRDMIRLGD